MASIRVVDLNQTLADVERQLRDSGDGLAVVCDAQRYVGVLRHEQLARELAQHPESSHHALHELGRLPAPGLPESSSPLDIRHFVAEHDLPVVPFTDRQGRLTRVLDRDDALRSGLYENAVLVMAGGFGVRLRPITANTPKPLVPLAEGTLLDRIIDHLLDCGFYRFYVAVHYLKEQVMDYLGDGHDRGIEVEYIVEREPQGTAGSLRVLHGRESLPILVTNGDVVTNQHLGEVLRFHHEKRAQLTVVCKEDAVDISYGVVECEADGTLTSIAEKPRLSYLINTGIYVVQPSVIPLVPSDKVFMTDLINRVRDSGGKVCVFITDEYWRDIGTIDCYAQVIKDVRSGLVRPLRSVSPRLNSSGALGRGPSAETLTQTGEPPA